MKENKTKTYKTKQKQTNEQSKTKKKKTPRKHEIIIVYFPLMTAPWIDNLFKILHYTRLQVQA